MKELPCPLCYGTGESRMSICDCQMPATPAAEGTRPMETKSLTFSEFSSINRTRCESPKGFSHALDSWSLSDWMTATAGELGEAANVVKKLNRVRDGIPGNDKSPEELRAMLADELADVFIYLDLMAQAAGVDLPTAVVTKFEKTSVKIGYIGDGLDVQGKPLAGKELASDLEDGCSR